jgi:hypothetical protein
VQPKPKPKPAPVQAPRQQSRPAQAPTPAPVYRAPVLSPEAPAARKPVRAKPKAKKKVQRKPPVGREVAVPTNRVPEVLGVSVGLRNPAVQISGGDSIDVASLVIVMGLLLSIGCFAVAMIPAAALRWRPVAIFVSERHLDLTVFGCAVLIVVAFTFFWTKGT